MVRSQAERWSGKERTVTEQKKGSKEEQRQKQG